MNSAASAAAQFLVAVVIVALCVLSLRRMVFAIAALCRPRAVVAQENAPSILILLAARDEAPVLGRVLRSFDRLHYAPDRLEITLIDDGSADETGNILAQWAQGRPRARIVTVPRGSGQAAGKAAALANGLAASPCTDLVAVVDADFELEPDSLSLLAGAFSEPGIGAVSGYLRPCNAGAGIVARYAALESWLHQLVTSAAKDRLQLDPPTIGLWVVRHDVLGLIGGFPDSVTGEDVRVTAVIAKSGFGTRFLSTAVASNRVAETLSEYWWQHLRWTRDVYATGRQRRTGRSSEVAERPQESALHAWIRRGEHMLSAVGYADRLILAIAVALALLGSLPPAILLGYVAAVLVGIGVAIRRGGSGSLQEAFRVLVATAVMFWVDVIATATATMTAALGRNATWHRRVRRPA